MSQCRVLLIFTYVVPAVLSITLKIPLGVLEGRQDESFNKMPYYSFEGVPFAEPPIGKLRFVAPVPVKPWSGTYNATYRRSVCPQPHNADNTLDGAEDCLHLSVYTPTTGQQSKLPVMIYFYGGGYQTGNSHQCTNAELFMESGNVMVKFNHRLGPLGFLTLDTVEVPGNAGLRDVIEVLKWVQKCIKYFGGDPDNVTLFGVSSGSVIIDIIRDAPKARGLFHKVICLSGNKPDLASRPGSTRKNSLKFLNLVNITLSNDTLPKLRDVPLRDLMAAAFTLNLKGAPYDYSSFAPIYEIALNRYEAAYSDVEDDILNCTVLNDIPTIFGHTSQDYFNAQKFIVDRYMSDSDDFIFPLNWNLTRKQLKAASREIKRHYFKGRHNFNMSSYEDFDSLFTLLAHVRIMLPTHNRAVALANCAKSPTYYQLFDYQGIQLSNAKHPFVAVMHGAEMYYYCPREVNRVEERSSDGWMRRRFVKMFSNFAKFGNPTPQISNLLPVTWKPFDPVSENYLHIGADLYPSVRPIHRTVNFWNGLKTKYFKKKRTQVIPMWRL